jgi:hypothetical protein
MGASKVPVIVNNSTYAGTESDLKTKNLLIFPPKTKTMTNMNAESGENYDGSDGTEIAFVRATR